MKIKMIITVYITAALLLVGVNSIAQTNIMDDLNAFTKSDVYTFNTKNHSKALGISFKIQIPKRWRQKEGERPHIVQNFSAAINGLKAVVCSIKVSKIPQELALIGEENQVADILFKKDIRSSFIPFGGKITLSEGLNMMTNLV